MADQPDPNSTQQYGEGASALSEPAGIDLRGRTLGDYRIERLLGRGGMGEVYLAHQISLDRPVAFKVLRADLLTNPVSLSRFEAEAAASAKINHPNIVHIYQMGNLQGLRFITMEYVEGTNLREYIQRKGGLELAPALSIMKQAALAVGAAGEAGLVHRDIKPENILLTRKGQAKVADFGLSRHLKADSVNLTQHGVALGTPMYMSPEQVQGKPVDHRSDLYSLGVTFFYLLAGKAPFHGDNAIAVALKHVHEKPPDLGALRPDLPRDLIRLVQKLMAKKPGDRYQSADEVARDLSAIRAANVDGPPAPGVVSTSMELIQPDLPTPPARVEKPVERHDSSIATGPETSAEAPPRSRFLTGRLVALMAMGLAIGGLSGWTKRPASLLAAGSPDPDGPPVLWIDPSWTGVPRQPSAESQYRYAQLQAPRGRREPAWLAVPGHYPADREWGFRALVQLGREYYRRHDEPRLSELARSLERSDNPRDSQLAHVARAGAAALRDDEEFLANFSLVNPNAMDPAVIELAVEIVSQRRKAQPDSPSARRLAKLQGDLLQALQVEFADLPMPARALIPRP